MPLKNTLKPTKIKTPEPYRRGIPWEVITVFFYLATPMAFVLALGAQAVDLLLAQGLGAWLALAVYGIFGLVIILAVHLNTQARLTFERQHSLFSNVFEAGTGAHLITDARQKCVYINQVFLDILQRRAKASIHDILARISEQDYINLVTDHIKQAHEGNLPCSVLFPIVNAQGEQRWCHLTALALKDWPGYIHWRLEDITERFLDDAMTRAEREQLMTLLDLAPIAVCTVDESGQFTYVNETLVSWVAGDQQTFENKQFVLHDVLETVPSQARAYDLMISDDDPDIQRGEIRLRAYDGRIFAVSVQHRIERDEDGAFVSAQTILRDMTPERAWKHALKQSEDRFQRFFENAPLGIALIDEALKLVECNEAFAVLLDQDVYDLSNRNMGQLVSAGDRAKLTDLVARVTAQARENDIDDEIADLIPSTPIRPVEISFDSGDKQVVTQVFASNALGGEGIILHFIDVTDQRNLEQQFTQSQKMQAVGQLAGGVAHDFNNLLTAMIGFCDLLLSRHRPGDPSFNDINQIKNNANRAANLVRQLLAFSRQQTLQPKILDISEVISDLNHLLRRLIGPNIDMDITHMRDVWPVKIDMGQMEQVMVNLVVNARDAINQASSKDSDRARAIKIDISTKTLKRRKRIGHEMIPTGDWVLVSVTDTGMGIPDEIVERIFDPFFTTKSVGEGTGLGLSTVHGIIHQTHGFIDVESEEGKGTSFIIYLPRVDEKEKDVEEDNQTAKQDKLKDLTGTSRILLVEDEEAVRSFSSRALTNKGYEVIEAGDGEEALEVMAELSEPVDLLVTDVIMPNMDGTALVRKVREDYPDLPVIFMSGYTEDKFKDDMDEEIHFLAKPFSLRALAEKVKTVLDEHK